jgi:hypothetical protein
VDANGRLPHNPLLCIRAITGWYLSRRPAAGPPACGEYVAAYLCRHEGTRYAVVTTTDSGSISDQVQVLGVYLIRGNDTLVQLRRWPGEIEHY